MVSFAILTTIAFVLLLLAAYSKMFFKGDKKVKWYNPGSYYFTGCYFTVAMALLIVAVWVTL